MTRNRNSPDRQLYLLVVGEDGYLYIYDFDKTEGGECTLVKQHRLGTFDSVTNI